MEVFELFESYDDEPYSDDGYGTSILRNTFHKIIHNNFEDLMKITNDNGYSAKAMATIGNTHILLEYDGFSITAHLETMYRNDSITLEKNDKGYDTDSFVAKIYNWIIRALANNKKKNVMEYRVTLADYAGRFKYVTNCVNGNHGKNGEAIHEMTDVAKQISYDTFIKAVDQNDVREVFHYYDWSKNPSSLTMKNDRYVRYFKSTWRKLPCVYVVHSAIEYIFTLNGETPKYDPRYD